jgi:hypothetical protein
MDKWVGIRDNGGIDVLSLFQAVFTVFQGYGIWRTVCAKFKVNVWYYRVTHRLCLWLAELTVQG